MARYSGGFRTAGAGSTTLPVASLYATATVAPRLFQVAVFNSTATAVLLALRFATTVGGTHTARDEMNWDSGNQNAATCTLFDTDTGTAPTLTAGNLALFPLGAAIGSGVIRTFEGDGIAIPKGTGNGLVVVPLVGAQIVDVDFYWRE
jgi:hypothetical protein